MMQTYGLPAVMELPPFPQAEADLLDWAKQIHSALQSSYIPQTDRIENLIMSDSGISRRPTPIGSRRLFYDFSAEKMYIDKKISETRSEWEVVGGAGLVGGPYLPLAGGTMLGAIEWENLDDPPGTIYPVADWTGYYWVDESEDPVIERFLGIFSDGLRLDDLSFIYYQDAVTGGVGVSFDILWWDYTTPTEEFLTLHSYNDLVLSAGEGTAVGGITIDARGGVSILSGDGATTGSIGISAAEGTSVGEIILNGAVILDYLRELFLRSDASTEILAISAEGNKDIEFGDSAKETCIAGSTDRPYYAKGAGTPVELALLSDAIGGGIDPRDGFVLNAGADIQFSSTSELQLDFGAVVTAKNFSGNWSGILRMDASTDNVMVGDVDAAGENSLYLYGGYERPIYQSTTGTPGLKFIAFLTDLPGGKEKQEEINDAMYEFGIADGLPDKVLSYVGGVLDLIEIYDSTPTKLYEKQFNYTGGLLTTIVLTRLSDMETWTKTMTYDVDDYLTEVAAA